MKTNTKAFWLQVKEEYDPHYTFICSTSKTFCDEWGESEKEYNNIRKLARKFLKEQKRDYPDIKVGSCFLFIYSVSYVRINFIDWCVKTLT